MDVGRIPPAIGQIVGLRHLTAHTHVQPDFPVSEVREGHTCVTTDAQHVFQHDTRLARRLESLRQNDIVEGVVRIIGKVRVGIALDHRQSFGDTLIHALARQLNATPVDAARLRQQPQQLAIAAADIEHARAALDHFGDQQQVDPRTTRHPRGVRHRKILLEALEHEGLAILCRPAQRWAGSSPRAFSAPSRNPRTIANSSGSSSKKASWPLSVTISANDTRARPALSACTIARESEVGNSQSDVKEMTQKRVGVSLNALASTPSKSAAMSK